MVVGSGHDTRSRSKRNGGPGEGSQEAYGEVRPLQEPGPRHSGSGSSGSSVPPGDPRRDEGVMTTRNRRRVPSSTPPITGGPAEMKEPTKATLYLDYRHICAYDGPKRGCPGCESDPTAAQ